MGLFKSIKLYNNVSTHVDTVANGFINSMKYEGYDVVGTKMPSGEWDISIKKGDLLRAVVGMQTAMKVVIRPNTPHAYFTNRSRKIRKTHCYEIKCARTRGYGD